MTFNKLKLYNLYLYIAVFLVASVTAELYTVNYQEQNPKLIIIRNRLGHTTQLPKISLHVLVISVSRTSKDLFTFPNQSFVRTSR
jgi:hypothetical protein